MRPKKPMTTEVGDLFRARLDQIINMKHELVQLAFKIDWDWIDGEIAPLYSDKGGRGTRPGSASDCSCSSTSTVCSTRPCAIAGFKIRISSTSPVRRFSSTSSRMSVRISAIGGSASVTSWSFCWPRV